MSFSLIYVATSKYYALPGYKVFYFNVTGEQDSLYLIQV